MSLIGMKKRKKNATLADPSVTDMSRAARDALHYYVKEGDVGAVRNILRNNFDVVNSITQRTIRHANVKEMRFCGVSSLWLASYWNNLPLVSVLLEFGAAVDHKSQNRNFRGGYQILKLMGSTPLWIASNLGHLEIIEALVSHGACVNEENALGETPLVAALLEENVEAADLLVFHGAALDYVNNRGGYTPLHVLAASASGYRGCQYLLNKGVNVDIFSGRFNTTPLIMAAREGSFSTCHLLLNRGANCAYVDRHPTCALARAARRHNNSALCLLLLTHGAAINQALDVALINDMGIDDVLFMCGVFSQNGILGDNRIDSPKFRKLEQEFVQGGEDRSAFVKVYLRENVVAVFDPSSVVPCMFSPFNYYNTSRDQLQLWLQYCALRSYIALNIGLLQCCRRCVMLRGSSGGIYVDTLTVSVLSYVAMFLFLDELEVSSVEGVKCLSSLLLVDDLFLAVHRTTSFAYMMRPIPNTPCSQYLRDLSLTSQEVITVIRQRSAKQLLSDLRVSLGRNAETDVVELGSRRMNVTLPRRRKNLIALPFCNAVNVMESVFGPADL